MLFLIKHKPTGHYMPAFKGGQRRGSTMIELDEWGTRAPRLYSNRTAAGNSLRWWLAGHAEQKYSSDRDDVLFGPEPIGIQSRPVPGRNPEDFAIVEVEIKEIN